MQHIPALNCETVEIVSDPDFRELFNFSHQLSVLTSSNKMDLNDKNILPDFCKKETLILGCGNRLFGDDGFGPSVTDYLLSHFEIPDDIYVADVGTGVRKLLFTLCLSPVRPRQIVIIDAIDKGKPPGELFEIPIQNLPLEKVDDFSLHQVPSSNLAKELTESGVNIRVLVCQAGAIPDSVKPGLSDALKSAVPRMCDMVAKEFCCCGIN